MVASWAWATAFLQNSSVCRPAPLPTLVGSWTVFWDTGAIRKLEVREGGDEDGGYLLVSASTVDGQIKGPPSRLQRHLSGPFTERAAKMELPAILGHESSDDLPPLLSYRLWTRFCEDTAVFQSDRLDGNASASRDLQYVRWNIRKAVAFRHGSVLDVPLTFEGAMMDPVFVAFANIKAWSFPEFLSTLLPPKGRIGLFSPSNPATAGLRAPQFRPTMRWVLVQSAAWRSRIVFEDPSRNVSGSQVSIALVAHPDLLQAAWGSVEDQGFLLGPCDFFQDAAKFAARRGHTLGRLRFGRRQCSWILSRGPRWKPTPTPVAKPQKSQQDATPPSSSIPSSLSSSSAPLPPSKLPIRDALDLYPPEFVRAGGGSSSSTSSSSSGSGSRSGRSLALALQTPGPAEPSPGFLLFGCKPMGSAGTGVRLGNVLFLVAATIAAAADTRRSMLAMVNWQWKGYFGEQGIFSLIPTSLWYFRSADIDMLVGSPASMRYQELVLPPEKQGIMMHGYFQNIQYFWHRLDLVRSMLMPPALRQKAREVWRRWMEEQALSPSSTFVALHVRLGDRSGLGAGYYRDAVSVLRKQLFSRGNLEQKQQRAEEEEQQDELLCVYFSDSPDRVLPAMVGTSCTRSFVFPDSELRDDLALMTMATCCSGIVVSASTFSWWAAVLGSYRNVVAPETSESLCSRDAASTMSGDSASSANAPSLSPPLPATPSSSSTTPPPQSLSPLSSPSSPPPHPRASASSAPSLRTTDPRSSSFANQTFSLGRVPGWVQIPVPCQWAAASTL